MEVNSFWVYPRTFNSDVVTSLDVTLSVVVTVVVVTSCVDDVPTDIPNRLLSIGDILSFGISSLQPISRVTIKKIIHILDILFKTNSPT